MREWPAQEPVCDMADRCLVCNRDNIRGHVPSPADAIAASICWLTKELLTPSSVAARLERRRRHPDRGCRYCSLSQAEKMALVDAGRRHAEDDPRWVAFAQLSKGAQYAKVCEAQEVSWVDSLPA